MPTVDTTLGPIAFSVGGQGAPLVLLHANPGDRRDFDAIEPALARSFRVHAVDWPGYGDSPPPAPASSASAMHYADVLSAFVDALALSPAIFLGNSVGGYAAARLAIDRPERVRALVLVGSGGFTPPGLVSRAFCAFKGREWVTRAIAGRFARYYLGIRNEHTRAMIARADEERRIPWRVAVDAAIWRSFADPEHDLRTRAARIAAPTLLAWGKHDPVLRIDRDGEAARRAIPGAVLHAFDTGHAPFAESPHEFLARVTPFLERFATKDAALEAGAS